MSDATPRLGLPWLMPAQAQKHVTVNAALGRLDALVGAAVQSRTRADQPGDPAEAAAYILPAAPSGPDWADFFETDLVCFQDGAWMRLAARAGLTAYVAEEGALVMFDGAAWRPFADAIVSLANLEGLGVGASADAANPFVARLNAALWTARYAADGGTGDLRWKLNKEAAGDTGAVLFQSDFSGRAEMGLIGDEDFSVKVSADGSVWREALRIGGADGRVAVARADVGALEALNGGPLGGLRNRIINGDFSVHQRGGPQTGDWFIDRWVRVAAGGVGHVFTREVFAPGQTDLPGDPECFLRWTMDGAPSDAAIEQRVEGVRTLAGRRATYSFYARASENLTLQTRLRQHFGAGSPAAAYANLDSHAVTPQWARFSVTLDVPALTGRTLAESNYLALRFIAPGASAAPIIELADVQLEEGAIATPFERRPPGLELDLCRRYFERISGADQPRHTIATGAAYNSTIVAGSFRYARKRANPAISSTGAIAFVANGTVSNAVSVNFSYAGVDGAEIQLIMTSVTQGQAGHIRWNNDPGGRIDISAEL